MDKDSLRTDRRKRAGMHEDYAKLNPIIKFGTNNWFRLVVISFLIIFTYQLNEIHNDMRYIDNDDSVTVDYLSRDVIRQLEKLKR